MLGSKFKIGAKLYLSLVLSAVSPNWMNSMKFGANPTTLLFTFLFVTIHCSVVIRSFNKPLKNREGLRNSFLLLSS